jgi:hypothetical protein
MLSSPKGKNQGFNVFYVIIVARVTGDGAPGDER